MTVRHPAVWAPADTEQSVPQRFTERAARHPSKTAVAGTPWQPTFEELDRAADAIASDLAARDGESRGRVALLMDHDAPLIAAMLGVLKAGQSIVVLNPGDPPGRLDRIRRHVDPWIALIDRRHSDLARRSGFDRFIEVGEPVPSSPEPSTESASDPTELAAIMYTSGSTGQPKGVMQTHHTLLHTALRHATGLGLGPDDRIALLASPSGGHGMGTTWMTLLTGATLCPFPVMNRGIAPLPQWLREHRITVLGLSASLFRRLIHSLDGASFPDLRLVRLGSEQVRRADFDACRRYLGDRCAFANVFSLTEGGGLAHGVLTDGEEPDPGPLSVGRPAEGVEIHLLDERGEPVPAGEPGEIVVSSSHLTPGYWRDEPLTTERFTSGPGGQRTFRTGDLGRLTDSGLVVDGRGDTQVKIRGYRVELTEVEAALRSIPGIEAAAARAEPTRYGDPRLTAYLVTGSEPEPEQSKLREALRSTLSDASIPSLFAYVDELPLTAHGKVDRERLADLSPRVSAAGFAAPVAELEVELSRLWAGALELEHVGRDDDFFDSGGDSLAAAEIGAGVHETLGVEIDMRAFARHPTVAEMASELRRRGDRRAIEGPALKHVRRNGPLPCSFAQERIWQFTGRQGGPSSYVMTHATGFDGPIDVEAMRAALAHVAARHEPLRTTFIERDGTPRQIVHPPSPIEIPLDDVSHDPDPDLRARDLIRALAAEPFDLEHGPLCRLHLVRVGEHEHRLLRASHHLVTDRASWRIFFTELVPAYDAIRRGAPPQVQEDRLQYADFAAWQRQSLRPDGSRYREQLAWWRDALTPSPPRLELPFARAIPASGLPPGDGNIRWGIDPAVVGALDGLGRESGATPYAVRLALFSALLGLETGQEMITVGAYVDTRRLPETQSMFGYFSNLITLVLPFDTRATLRAWTGKVRLTLIDAIARGDLPHQHLSDELRASGQEPPEINAIFSVRSPMPELPFGEVERIPNDPTLLSMPWGFNFTVDQKEESSRCQVDFDAHLHDPGLIRRFIERYAGLAEAAGTRPDRPLGDLHAAIR
ncbi:MAG TPA: AMP-binding protein [Solirubrobacterales bacterium]|nr:AMP-binding protein [Solirubrobacterales bacterium]